MNMEGTPNGKQTYCDGETDELMVKSGKMQLSLKEKVRLYHDLGTMLSSGFHLDRGIDLLLAQNPSRGVRCWLEGLRDGLHDKLGVADAIRRQASGTSELEIGLIEAGERGGKLDEACKHLAAYFELRQRSLNKAVGALIYPVILAHLGAFFPDLSKVMLGGGLASAFAGVPARLAILWILLAVIFFTASILTRLTRTSVLADRIVNCLPLVGSIRRHWALARFSQVMQTGLLASLKVSEVLRLAGGATQSALMNIG
ncbi:MAG: type II secretion system F family protein, partial [Verrucomicrobiaceae bacterium]